MDLSPDIKRFAAENEMEIKAVLMQMLMEYYDSTVSENYEGKWDEGVLEHGGVTDEKINSINWVEELTKEMKDAFWYVTLILFRQRRGQ
jgi:hypothetical protein